MNITHVINGAIAGLVLLPHSVYASETIAYSYDAQGRLIGASHSGTGPSSGLNIQTQYDLAGNRIIQTVTGSANTGQQVVVTPAGNGFNVIPVNP